MSYVSNVKAVCRKVEELGAATVDSIAPHLPHLTRKQILDALKNGRVQSLVKVGKRGGRAGQRKGSLPSTWVPCDKGERYQAKPKDDDDEESDELGNNIAPRGEYAHVGRVNSVFAMGGA